VSLTYAFPSNPIVEQYGFYTGLLGRDAAGETFATVT